MAHRILKRNLLGLVPIDLPIAVPSLPVVAPVLTNLVHGDNPSPTPSSTHHSSSPTTTPPTQPTQPNPTSQPTPTTPVTNPTPPSQPDPSAPSVTIGNSISVAAPSVIVSISGTGSDAIPVTLTLTGSLPSNIQNAAAQPSSPTGTSGADPNAAESPGSPNGTLQPNPNQSSIPGSPSNPSGSIVAHPGSPSASSTASHHKGFPAFAIGLLVTVGVIAGLFLTLFLIRKRNRGRREARRTLWLPVMAEAANGLPSARSSFATNFDHGLRAPTPDNNIPSLPPPVVVASRASSDSLDAQYLFVDRPSTNALPTVDSNGQPLPSPISVRPFSPTESYRFPRPPSHAATPPSTSNATLIDLDDSPQPLQNLPPIPTTAKRNELVEVKRPFAPSLADELYIEPGEFVHIMDAFDDGWALVAKPNGLKGLAPLACFEETDQDVDIPAFLAAHKRRSSMANFGVAC